MSTTVAGSNRGSAVPADAADSSLYGLAAFAIGLLAAAGAGLLLATADHLADPLAFGIQVTLMVVGTTAAALYWLVRRPGNRLGLALLVLAIATAFVALIGASQPLLYSIGVTAQPVVFLTTYYVIFAFPEGRVAGRLEWGLLAAWTLYFVLSFVPVLLFSPLVQSGAPLTGCTTACPENGLMIANRPSLAAGFGSDMSYMVIAVAIATIACLLYRLATASRPRRRALVPVYIPALMLTVPLLIFHGVATQVLHLAPDTLADVGWSVTIGRIALPYGFLLAVVLATLFAAAALKTIVGRLVGSPDAAQLRTVLADALDDPSLELALQLEPSGELVDSSGQPVAGTPLPGQSATPVRRNGRTVAVIMHDAALGTDPELVGAAGQAVLLAIENGRLTDELQSRNAELRATRARIVAVGEAERRRIERDLHDGAQQHLVALRIKVGLAAELADPKAAERLASVGDEVEEILNELRDLARGLYPPELRTLGLQGALATVARRSVPPAQLDVDGIGRYSEDVEAAVYFCCVESLQNVAKHAGAGVTASIRVWEHDGQLCFQVADDGAGSELPAAAPGMGHTNMIDRMLGVGGTLAVESAPGRGTTVSGRLPVAT